MAKAAWMVATGLAMALSAGCGGRGGYEADRAAPAMDERMRDIQRSQQDTLLRVIALQNGQRELGERLRQAEWQCRPR